MVNRPVSLGSNVRVISGDHAGRGGTVTYLKDQSVGYGEPETFALVQYRDDNSPGGVDEIAVPTRRLEVV